MQKQSVCIVRNIKSFLKNLIDSGGFLIDRNVNLATAKATGVRVTTIKKVSEIEDLSNYHTPTKCHLNKNKLPITLNTVRVL